MTTYTFRNLSKFNDKVEKRIRAAARTAVQETLSEASAVQKRGGRMRVKTGFLRASLQASLDGMPTGLSVNVNDTDYGDGERNGLPDQQVSGAPVFALLLQWDANDGKPFMAGWTANYAVIREHKDGFLRGAAQNWRRNVERAAKEAQRRIR